MMLKGIGGVVEGSILPGAVGKMMKMSSYSQADNSTLLKKSFTTRLGVCFYCIPTLFWESPSDCDSMILSGSVLLIAAK